jgi:hypothetical protein
MGLAAAMTHDRSLGAERRRIREVVAARDSAE